MCHIVVSYVRYVLVVFSPLCRFRWLYIYRDWGIALDTFRVTAQLVYRQLQLRRYEYEYALSVRLAMIRLVEHKSVRSMPGTEWLKSLCQSFVEVIN